MNNLKQILTYVFWTIFSLLAGVVYMRIVLGPKPEPSTGFLKMFDWAYDVALIQVGFIIGGIIALLYILLDVLYLKQKLKNHSKKTIIRFLMIIVITAIVGTIHYIFEKVIDII